MENKIRILIVDEDAESAAELKNILFRLNCEVISILRTGEEALVKSSAEKPDLVMLAFKLGGRIDGVKTAERIKNRLNLPVIFLHTKNSKEKIIEEIDVSPSHFLSKPYTESSIKKIIDPFFSKNSDNREEGTDELYGRLAELIPVALVLQCEGVIEYVNRSFISLLGCESKHKILGKPFANLIHPDDMMDAALLLNEIEDHSERSIFDVKLKCMSGKIIDVEVTAVKTIYMKKPALQFACRDISAEKKRERIQQTTLKLLQWSNHVYSLDALLDYVHKTLSEFMPVNNFYVALYNKIEKRLSFPYFKDEYKGKPEDRIGGKGLTEYVLAKKESLLLDSDKINGMIEAGYIHPSSQNVKSWLGVPLFIEKDIAGVIVVKEYHHDLIIGEDERELLEIVSFPIARAIERMINEEERKSYTDKLKELNDAKDKFFSIISHDLRSPFNSILGFSEILKENNSTLSKEEISAYSEAMYNSTRNVYNLVENLLQYSRFQMGKTEFEPEPVVLYDIVEHNIEMLRGNALRKRITLSNKVKSEISVFASEDMLSSVFQNLISNAVKFTGEHGTVTVDAEELNESVRIKVSDTGVGMGLETLEKLFILDSKKSQRGTGNEKGTGLGLIIVKEFIEKNEGHIQVKSQIGEGSEFIITLPSAKSR